MAILYTILTLTRTLTRGLILDNAAFACLPVRRYIMLYFSCVDAWSTFVAIILHCMPPSVTVFSGCCCCNIVMFGRNVVVKMRVHACYHTAARQIFRIGTVRYAVRPVTHAQTWASYSALYRFGRLSQLHIYTVLLL